MGQLTGVGGDVVASLNVELDRDRVPRWSRTLHLGSIIGVLLIHQFA